MSSSFTALPLPLILLIHLRILDYPYSNEPQYNKDCFDGRSKGLKDRVQMMEDICYFLVSQLEDNPRNILPAYPCTQPSDNLAFRTSLFKYLETLRYRALNSSSQKISVNRLRGPKTTEMNVQVSEKTAWWWKDVMVRKSLLEECSGERFVCLLVAFSTHVLFHKTSAYTRNQLFDLAATASFSYNSVLLRCQSNRHLWIHKGNLLVQRRQKIDYLKSVISANRVKTTSNSIAQDHLVSLAKVKYDNIQSRLWPGERGSVALANLLRLAGVASVPHGNELVAEEQHAKLANNHLPAVPPSLQHAATRYPAELRQLRRPEIFPPQSLHCMNLQSPQSLLSSVLTEVKAIYARLSEAHLKIQQQRNLLQVRPSRAVRPHGERTAHLPFLLTQPLINRTLLERFSLHDPTEISVEQRLDHIRQHMLIPLPSPPDLSCPGVTPPDLRNTASRLPQTKSVSNTGRSASSETSDTLTPKNTRILQKSRKIIKASLVQNMVKTSSDERKQMFEDEAAKIILETRDDSMEEIEFTTPRSKAPPNRIWTSGQKRTPTTSTRTPLRSPMFTCNNVAEPVGLPFVPTTSTGSMSRLEDEDSSSHQIKFTDKVADGVLEDGEWSQTSMTLRELLIAADESSFALIEDEEEGYVEEYSGWE